MEDEDNNNVQIFCKKNQKNHEFNEIKPLISNVMRITFNMYVHNQMQQYSCFHH